MLLEGLLVTWIQRQDPSQIDSNVLLCVHIERFISIMNVRLGQNVLSTLRNRGCPHFRGFVCTKLYVNTFGTMQSVCIIVDVHISGVSARQGSTVDTARPLSHDNNITNNI